MGAAHTVCDNITPILCHLQLCSHQVGRLVTNEYDMQGKLQVSRGSAVHKPTYKLRFDC